MSIRRAMLLERADEWVVDLLEGAGGPEVVYLIAGCLPDGRGVLKIGVSAKPFNRLGWLEQETGLKLRLIGAKLCQYRDEALDLERALHDRFADLWIGREWFHDDPRIRAEFQP